MASTTFHPSIIEKQNREPLGKEEQKMPVKKSNFQQRSYIPIAQRPYTPLNQSYLCLPPVAPSNSAELPERITKVIESLETDQQQKAAKENLLKTRSFRLPAPLELSDDQQRVILWRGCGERQLVRAALYGCFSTTPNEEALPPSEEETKKQVGEKINLPEFTALPNVAEGFGTNKFVAAFAIETRYLSKGSPSEDGFICSYDAPVTLVGWREGRKILPETVDMLAASKRRQLSRESSIASASSAFLQPPKKVPVQA
ncbi:MAG: DUF4765 family protein [Verrucomicrobia bacterium]|nr:DUF4765 family protein [Verrucomicrobiota bacterium]